MPAREQIGIDVSMTENVSQAAGNAGRSVDQLRERIATLNNELSPDKARQYFDAMNQQAQERQQRQGQNNILQFPAAAGNATRRLGGTVSGLGATGDAGQAVGSAAEGAGSLLRGVGGAVGIAAGGTLIAAGAAVAGLNAMTKPYEGVMEEVMDLTMQLGEYGETAVEQSRKFVDTMDRASEAGARFGYRLEETMGVMSSLAERGASGDVAGLAGYTMQFARGFGMDPGALAGFVGTGARFGQKNSLEGIAGMLNRQDMSPARFGEMMNAQLGIFEDALSRGVIKGFDEIGSLQNMFASGGELFRGELGAQRIRQMDNVVAGASSLGREEDVLMYRAARSLGEEDESYIDTMKRLEAGLTGDMFTAIRDQVESMSGGNESQMIEMLRSIFNVNYTTAEALLGMSEEDAVSELADAPDTTETYEVRLLRSQENIREHVRLISQTLIDQKAMLSEEFEELLGAFQEHFFDQDDEDDSRNDLTAGEIAAAFGRETIDPFMAGTARFTSRRGTRDQLQSILEGMDPERALELMGMFDSIGSDQASYIRSSGSLDNWITGKSGDEIMRMLPGQLRSWGRQATAGGGTIGSPADFLSEMGVDDETKNAILNQIANTGNHDVVQRATRADFMNLVQEAESRKAAYMSDERGFLETRDFSLSERTDWSNDISGLLRELIRVVQTPTEVTVPVGGGD